MANNEAPMMISGGPGGVMESRPATPEEIAASKKLRVIVNDDGTQTLTDPASGEEVTVDPARLGEYETPARRRLKRLRQNPKEDKRIERFEIVGDDEPWFVKRGGLGELAAQSAWAPRDRLGRLIAGDEDSGVAYAGFVAALLLVYVASGEGDETPLFESFPDAYDFADSRDQNIMKIADSLVDKIIELNPMLKPQSAGISGSGEAEAEKELEKKDESGGAENAVSSTPPLEAPSSGSSDTASNAAPASLLTVGDASQSMFEATP